MTEEGDLLRNGINGASNSLNNTATLNLSKNSNSSNNHHNNLHHPNRDVLSGSLILPSKSKLPTSSSSSSSSLNNEYKNRGGGPSGINAGCDGPITTTGTTPGPSGGGNSGGSLTNSSPTFGGRLQFFKDGKFILELARARDGDRTSWVSVPRKTYWPPTASNAPPPTTTATVNYHKNESSTSLSFSDDNSSIQSSPWQRDHCWKQTTPRRNISKEMNFYLHRPSKTHNFMVDNKRVAKVKRRRPYDQRPTTMKILRKVKTESMVENGNCCSTTTTRNKRDGDDEDVGRGSSSSPPRSPTTNSTAADMSFELKTIKEEPDDESKPLKSTTKSTCGDVENGGSNSTGGGGGGSDDCVDGGKENSMEVDRDSSEQDKISGTAKLKSSKDDKNQADKKLSKIIQKLADRKSANLLSNPTKGYVGGGGGGGGSNLNNLSKSDAHHLAHVSPRKRILRELEKVTLEDSQMMKKSRAKTLATSNGNTTTSGNTPSTIVTATSIDLSGGGGGGGVPKSVTGSVVNSGSGNGEGVPVVAQPVSRPISSYSITSLLGHNNNNVKHENSSVTIASQQSQQQQNVITDPSHLRAMLTSPKSPEYRHPKYGFEKMKSPSYNNSNLNLSPKLGGGGGGGGGSGHSYHPAQNRSPSVSDGGNYGMARSPGPSPSPENNNQVNYHRYRPSTSSSSPNYHPYMSSSSSSRCSPSGTISPTSDVYSRYRSNYIIGSPNNSTSSASTYSRQSPNSLYSQQQQQHHKTSSAPPPPSSSSAYNSKLMSSPTHHLNNLNITVNKIRESSSPCSSPTNSLEQNNQHHHHHQQQQHQHYRDISMGQPPTPSSQPPAPSSSSSSTSSSINFSSSTRTVPKKTAAFRQQYGGGGSSGGVSSPSVNMTTVDSYYKTAPMIDNKYEKDDHRRRTPCSNESLSTKSTRSPGPSSKNLDNYSSSGGGGTTGGSNSSGSLHHPSPTSAAATASMLYGAEDLDSFASMHHRLSHPSLSQPHGMYFLHPSSYHGQAAAAAAAAAAASASPPGAPYPPFYHPMYSSAVNAAAYRNSLWLQYPNMVSSSAARFSSLLPFGGAPGILEQSQHAASVLSSSPWGSIPQKLGADPLALVRNKEEPCSDVPLNLSKH